MPTRTYTRKDDTMGRPGDPSRGNPSFLSAVTAALPGRTWRSVASDAEVKLVIDGDELTPQEEADLTAGHTAWVATCQCRYSENFEVEKITDGRTDKIEWFETDDGEGDYSDLVRDEIWDWEDNVLKSITKKRYFRDGTEVPRSMVKVTYYTTGTGDKVKKVTT
jgi:hypothetical protein